MDDMMNVDSLNNWWVTGFVDGEGCFNVSFTKRAKMKFGYEVRLSFSVSQHKRSLQALEMLKCFFKVGGIRFSIKDNCYKYEVRDIVELDVIIKHFRSYALLTAKKTDFMLFCEIYTLVASKHHLSKIGFSKVVKLGLIMKRSGRRKYSEYDLLKLIEVEDIV
jgi:hypothetical protein